MGQLIIFCSCPSSYEIFSYTILGCVYLINVVFMFFTIIVGHDLTYKKVFGLILVIFFTSVLSLTKYTCTGCSCAIICNFKMNFSSHLCTQS